MVKKGFSELILFCEKIVTQHEEVIQVMSNEITYCYTPDNDSKAGLKNVDIWSSNVFQNIVNIEALNNEK